MQVMREGRSSDGDGMMAAGVERSVAELVEVLEALVLASGVRVRVPDVPVPVPEAGVLLNVMYGLRRVGSEPGRFASSIVSAVWVSRSSSEEVLL